MARIEGRAKLNLEVVMVLTEQEAGALDALVGYGFDSFKEVFYEKMGKAYMEKYESGLRSLFESVRTGDASVSGIIDRAKDAREVFNGVKVAQDRIAGK